MFVSTVLVLLTECYDSVVDNVQRCDVVMAPYIKELLLASVTAYMTPVSSTQSQNKACTGESVALNGWLLLQ